MTLKIHTGITFTIFGILLPFFGSVCLASTSGYHQFLSRSLQLSEQEIAFDKQDAPASASHLRQDLDFIHRLKNNRFLPGSLSEINGEETTYLLPSESSFIKSYLVPKPGYYYYLFLFKPF